MEKDWPPQSITIDRQQDVVCARLRCLHNHGGLCPATPLSYLSCSLGGTVILHNGEHVVVSIGWVAFHSGKVTAYRLNSPGYPARTAHAGGLIPAMQVSVKVVVE